MKETLKSIQKKIKSVTGINYVDEDWGQLNDFAPNIPVKWPCVLINFNQGSFSDIGRSLKATPANRQQGTLNVELIVANLKLSNSSGMAPVSQKNNAFEIWNLVQKVHEAVHGWNPGDDTGAMIRSSFTRVRRSDGVQELRVIYSIGLHDC